MANTIFRPLQAGDTVDVIAPAAKCAPQILDQAKELLANWGLKANIPETIFGDDLLYANTDQVRFDHLQQALINPVSKAVWCLRGGFGSTRLVPMLSQIKPQAEKLFIGFSDITALHIFLQQNWGWRTLHGPGLKQVATNKINTESIQLLQDIFFGKLDKHTFMNVVPLNQLAQQNMVVNAPVTGGNLSLVQCSLGTVWQIDTADKILLLEEVEERAYRVERILDHLHQVGVFNRVKAIIFGDFTNCNEPNGKSFVQEVLARFAKLRDVPVVQIPGIGHGKINYAIPLGVATELKLGNALSLTYSL